VIPKMTKMVGVVDFGAVTVAMPHTISNKSLST
jgi:hypothetical protein